LDNCFRFWGFCWRRVGEMRMWWWSDNLLCGILMLRNWFLWICNVVVVVESWRRLLLLFHLHSGLSLTDWWLLQLRYLSVLASLFVRWVDCVSKIQPSLPDCWSTLLFIPTWVKDEKSCLWGVLGACFWG